MDSVEEFLRTEMRHETDAIRPDAKFVAEAVDRGPRVRQRRRRTAWLSVAATTLVLAVVAGTLSGRFGVDNDSPQPAPATQPTNPAPQARRSPVLLASAELEDGRQVQLVAYGAGEWPCLRITGIDELFRECGNAPSEREPSVTAPIIAEATAQRTKTAPFEVYGATAADVTRVVVRFRVHGDLERTEAVLLRVTDTEALREAEISEPFGFFLTELPADTTADVVQADAFDAAGNRLGSADYSHFMDLPPQAFIGGPTNQLNTSHSEPPSRPAAVTMQVVRRIAQAQEFRPYTGPRPPTISKTEALESAPGPGGYSLGLWDIGIVHVSGSVDWHSVWIIGNETFLDDLTELEEGGGVIPLPPGQTPTPHKPQPGWVRSATMIDAITGGAVISLVY